MKTKFEAVSTGGHIKDGEYVMTLKLSNPKDLQDLDGVFTAFYAFKNVSIIIENTQEKGGE